MQAEHLYENKMFTNKVNAALMFGGKGKAWEKDGNKLALIKRVKLTQVFEKTCGVVFVKC